MTTTDIQIISKLFEFLSAYTPDELASAATSSLITANVGEALAALARARQETSPTPAVAESKDISSNGTPKHPKVLEEQFYAALADQQLIPSAAEMVKTLSRLGIRVSASPTEGRSRPP